MQNHQNGIKEIPTALAVVVLPFPSESDSMSAFLPVEVISGLIPIEDSVLRCAGLIADHDVAAVDLNLRASRSDATRIRRWAIAFGGNVACIVDSLVVEASIVDDVLSQDRRQPCLDVVIPIPVISPV